MTSVFDFCPQRDAFTFSTTTQSLEHLLTNVALFFVPYTYNIYIMYITLKYLLDCSIFGIYVKYL